LRRESVAAVVRARLHAAGARPMLTTALNFVYFLLPDDVNPALIWEAIGDASVSFAIGRRYRGTKGTRRSFVEAKSLLTYRDPSPIRAFEESLVPRVLMGDAAARAAFLDDLFAPLRAKKGGRALEQAVLALAKTGFNHKKTAEQLNIHLNTLRYRLAHVADILGISLDEPETRFRLQLAVRLLDFSHNT
jgi:purine catabolism regulator